MKHISGCLFLLIICLSAAHSAFAQNAADAVEFRISFADGKAQYRTGEPIRLILSYTAAQPGYVVETYYSPRFDDIILSPADGIYPWLYRLNRLYSYDDVSAPQNLYRSPVSVEITVNDLVRFDKPGTYRVKVLSRRVWMSKSERSFRSNAMPLFSNEIKFEIREMSEAEERAEVKRITALMDSARTLHEHQAFKRELDYLTGDVSTIEKVKRFLKPPVFGGISWLDSGTGLNIARNKKLAIELLEADLRDPNREVNETVIRQLTTLRLLTEDERQPSLAADPEQLGKEREARSAEISRAYYAELFESLPRRAGRSRLVAAYRIFTSPQRNVIPSDARSAAKTFLLEKFDELKHYEQSILLDRYWDEIKSPALIPSLEKILSSEEPAPVWSNRANALKRLIELDSRRARPFVINEIRDPNSSVNHDVLKTLDDEFLPEVDAALLEQIQKLASTQDHRIQYKFLLAARFATRGIYQELLDVYKKYGINWNLERSGPLLSYLLRHNEREAIPLIEERLAKWGEKSGSHVFFNLTRASLPDGLEKILRKRLEIEEPEVAATAAYYLSKYPSKENRRLIEKRHQRWLKEWAGRKAELDDPAANDKIKGQARVQIELLSALLRTKEWKLSDTEIYQLKLQCLTQACRQNFSSRY